MNTIFVGQDGILVMITSPTEKTWDYLTVLMDEVSKGYNEEVNTIAEELNISKECAANVFYFRSTKRWSSSLESKLIKAFTLNQRIDIFNWS